MKLFNWAKLITVNNNKAKEQIQELFAEHNIQYKMKVKEIIQKNAFDTAMIGTLGNNKMKLNYSFYIEKENFDIGRHLISSIDYSQF